MPNPRTLILNISNIQILTKFMLWQPTRPACVLLCRQEIHTEDRSSALVTVTHAHGLKGKCLQVYVFKQVIYVSSSLRRHTIVKRHRDQTSVYIRQNSLKIWCLSWGKIISITIKGSTHQEVRIATHAHETPIHASKANEIHGGFNIQQ